MFKLKNKVTEMHTGHVAPPLLLAQSCKQLRAEETSCWSLGRNIFPTGAPQLDKKVKTGRRLTEIFHNIICLWFLLIQSMLLKKLLAF